MRVLVAGSQFFTDLAVISAVLSLVWEPDAVLVTGGCPKGAEESAARCWSSWGGRVERWEFDWDRPWGDVVSSRNRAMLKAGADLCLGFGATSGMTSLTTAARDAEVPVYEWQAGCGIARRL